MASTGCQATFRPTPEVVPAFSSTWRVLSISVQALSGITIANVWIVEDKFSWLATGKLSNQLLWRGERNVPNDWLWCSVEGPLLQTLARCIQRLALVRRKKLVLASVTTKGAAQDTTRAGQVSATRPTAARHGAGDDAFSASH